MKLEARKYLYDIQHALGLLQGFTAGKGFGDYERDAMLRAAVERELEIIGEAMSQLAKIDPTLASRISEYQRIIGFRNVIVHQYSAVDDRLVWAVIETKIPTLHREVEALLDDGGELSTGRVHA